MHTVEPEHHLISKTSVTELCAAWNETERQVREAFTILVEAQERLNKFFNQEQGHITIQHYSRSVDFTDPDEAVNRMSKQVWGQLIKRLELRKILSLARINELDKQLETGEGLPPITIENINAMLESNINCMGQYLEEKVKEVYEYLRPSWRSEYKTNQKSLELGVGKKVIMTWYAVERGYSRKGGFQINYNSKDKFCALDQVFHVLDGAPQSRDHYGELVSAVELQTDSTKNTFETPYFKGKCFKNGNMHLEFKRDDLLEKFNLVAGGMRLKDVSKHH